MDEHAEQQRELAELARDDRDDAREHADAVAHWHENAIDLFFSQCFRPLDDR